MATHSSPKPVFRGTTREDVDESIVGGSAFETTMLSRFLIFTLDGVKPDGTKTSLPLLLAGGMGDNLQRKYKDWALEPHRSMPAPAMMGFALDLPSPCAMIRISQACGGMNELMNQVRTFSIHGQEASFASMKNRVWFGMSPMTAAQWKARGLDDRENIEEALAVVRQVIDIFRHLRSPYIHGQLRRIHNNVWCEVDIFQDAINNLSASNGDAEPPFNMTWLWQEFIDNHFDFMVSQARAWIYQHLKVLHTSVKGHFVAKMTSGRQINETQVTMTIDHWDLLFIRHLLDLYRDAGLFVHRATDGFVNNKRGVHIALSNIEGPDDDLVRAYTLLEFSRIAEGEAMIKEVHDGIVHEISQSTLANGPWFFEEPKELLNREYAYKDCFSEIENPKNLHTEPWITKLAQTRRTRFGFVVYRLSYTEDNEAWSSFINIFNDGITSGWQGVVGAPGVRGKEQIYWIDGRTEKIPEGDVKAARSHFKRFSNDPNFPKDLEKNVCLGVTPNSVSSFLAAKGEQAMGDFRGFLHVIDATFKPKRERASTLPDALYKGHFKIIDQLVWTDLLARGGYGQEYSMYWQLAQRHPWGVYVSSTRATPVVYVSCSERCGNEWWRFKLIGIDWSIDSSVSKELEGDARWSYGYDCVNVQ